MPTADTIAQSLLAAAQAPPPELTRVYPLEEIPAVLDELETVEAELDVRHRGWRERQPFHMLPRPVRDPIKLLLKRRDLLLHGHRSWGVYIDHAGNAVAKRPPPEGRPVTVWLEQFSAPVSASVLAAALDLSLETVETAIAEARAKGERPTRAWIRRWAKRPEEEPAPVKPAPVKQPARRGAK